MNETIRKFGYPHTLVREYDHWVVLLRPKQVTLASLVMACKDEAKSLSEITPDAFAQMAQVTREIETTLRRAFAYDRINYLLLMMVDPDVHFHVIPRYASGRIFEGAQFTDPGWPKTPELTHEHAVAADTFEALRTRLIEAWGQ
jgi:diadenosine tetraphosphate (Ap4A) HIT family hydrolase